MTESDNIPPAVPSTKSEAIEASQAAPPNRTAEPKGAWRGYVLLLGALLLIKSLVLGWGVYAAHNGQLSLRDYEHNFHHHRLIARYKDPSRIEFFELWVSSDPQWYFAIAEDGYPRGTSFKSPKTRRRPN